MAKENTSIVACGKKFDTGCRVILWNEEEGLSFYPGGPHSKGKYKPRDVSLKRLREDINCFVIHHSVTYTAHATFRGLKGRGLSVNFIIDDDVNEDTGCATIYQCLDVKDIGYSHKPINNRGAGVEISWHPQAWESPNMYSKKNRVRWGVEPHDIVSDRIHGMKFKKVFAPTEAQVNACTHLLYGYSKAFPNLKTAFPRDSGGKLIKTTTDDLSGFLHHFHITRNKIDAMGFTTDKVEDKVNGMLEEDKALTGDSFKDKLLKWLL